MMMGTAVKINKRKRRRKRRKCWLKIIRSNADDFTELLNS